MHLVAARGEEIGQLRAEPARGKIRQPAHVIQRLIGRPGGDDAVHGGEDMKDAGGFVTTEVAFTTMFCNQIRFSPRPLVVATSGSARFSKPVLCCNARKTTRKFLSARIPPTFPLEGRASLVEEKYAGWFAASWCSRCHRRLSSAHAACCCWSVSNPLAQRRRLAGFVNDRANGNGQRDADENFLRVGHESNVVIACLTIQIRTIPNGQRTRVPNEPARAAL